MRSQLLETYRWKAVCVLLFRVTVTRIYIGGRAFQKEYGEVYLKLGSGKVVLLANA